MTAISTADQSRPPGGPDGTSASGRASAVDPALDDADANDLRALLAGFDGASRRRESAAVRYRIVLPGQAQ